MNEDQIPTVSLIAHESECAFYCKVIKWLVALAVAEAAAFGVIVLTAVIH